VRTNWVGELLGLGLKGVEDGVRVEDEEVVEDEEEAEDEEGLEDKESAELAVDMKMGTTL
jgi:hypothetical protein